MSESWHSLTNLNCKSANIILANALVTADSPWFSGHFPAEPILPGIAELSIIFDIIKQCKQENGSNIKVVSIKRVRFKFPVRPEDSLDIKVSSNESKTNTYSFKIMASGELACSGIIIVEQNG